MDLQRLVIANPSGNITAIVFDEIARKNMPWLGGIIQRDDNYPSVEQVLFVEGEDARMAGGEFCGNGARAFGYMKANGRESEQRFSMSGVSEPVTVTVWPQRAKLEFKTSLRNESRVFAKALVSVVHMEDKIGDKYIDGISHAIFLSTHPLYHSLKSDVADRKEVAREVLSELGLTQHKASGLIFVDKRADGIGITPYVFVRDADTLCEENACASGSVAAASVLGVNAAVMQPSGHILKVGVSPWRNLTLATVDGSMSIERDGFSSLNGGLDLDLSPQRLIGAHINRVAGRERLAAGLRS